MITLYHMSMSLHALLLLASQLVPHPLLIKFAASFFILALQKCLSTDVLFHEPISKSHLLMIYGSSPLQVQPHPLRWWLLKKSGSRNSTATLLLMNILRLLPIPRIFDMISYLVPISYHTWLWKSPSTMDGIHYSSSWCFGIFSFNYYTSILSPLELEFEHDLIGNPVVDTFAMHILDAKYKQANIHNVAFDQQHLSLDQPCNLFHILSKH